MDTRTPITPNRQAAQPWRTALLAWLPVTVGLVALYFPSFADLFNGAQAAQPGTLLTQWVAAANPLQQALIADAR